MSVQDSGQSEGGVKRWEHEGCPDCEIVVVARPHRNEVRLADRDGTPLVAIRFLHDDGEWLADAIREAALYVREHRPLCESCGMPNDALGPDGEVWHEGGICPGPTELRSKDAEHCDDCGGRIEGGPALGAIFCDTCTKRTEL